MPEDIVRRILRLAGWKVIRHRFEEETSTVTLWVQRVGSAAVHVCGGCGMGKRRVHSVRERQVRDLPWGTWRVWLVLDIHRIYCRGCGVRTERIDFLEGKHPYTARFSQAVARDCEDAPVHRVAAKWGLSPQTARCIDKRALEAWSRNRRRPPLRQLGVDEIFWRKGQCLTVTSDLEAGEPIWAAPERKQESLDRFFIERLPPRRRRAVQAVCVDMWKPYLQSLSEHLPRAAIVFDKFHVMKHVNAAVDETRRAEFFRQGGALRALIRGKRWLLLTRWKNLSRAKRGILNEAFARNRRLFKAYYLKEQIERLWRYSYEGAARNFFRGVGTEPALAAAPRFQEVAPDPHQPSGWNPRLLPPQGSLRRRRSHQCQHSSHDPPRSRLPRL